MEKSNGWRHSVWEASGNMGCELRRCNFSALYSLFSGLDKLSSGLFFHHVKFYLFKHKISTRVVCANGKLPQISENLNPSIFVKTMHNIPKILT